MGPGLDDVPVGQRQLGGRRADDADLALSGERREAVHAGQDLGRPRVANRTLPRPHRTAGHDRKQLRRGIGRHRGGGQQEAGVDLSDGQRHGLAMLQAGRLTLRTPCI